MRLHPRTRQTLAALLACVSSCAFFNVARAQTRGDNYDATARSQSAPKQAEPKHDTQKQGAQKKTDADAARRAREVREAVAALREVADAARSFDDLYESTRAQSDAADVLWPYDEQAARAVLRRAWEAVTAPGVDEKVRGGVPSEIPGEGMSDELTEERRLIIEAAVKHDRRLADTFMREFEHILSASAEADREQEDAQPDGPAPSHRYERSLSPAGWQRLFIARQLVEAGEYRRASEMAAPLVGEGACPALLDFILSLLPHDEGDAHTLYLRLLERTRADASADANDVLLLSSPVVSPGLRIFISGGSTNFILYSREDAPPLPSRVRGAFFDTAATILLRAPIISGNADELYFTVGHLLPFFERESQQYAPALHARLASLAADVAPSSRESLDGSMGIRTLSPKNPTDPLAPLLSQLSSETAATKDAAARDHMRLDVVLAASKRGLWDRARTVAAEVEGADARRYARLVIAIRQVLDTASAFDDDDNGDAYARAADFVRAADVPQCVRAAGLAQAAELAARHGKRERADALLREAQGLAAQAERGEERATALALVTLSAIRAEAPCVWELMTALARAADEADDLPYGALSFDFDLSNPGEVFSFLDPSTAGLSFNAPEPPVSLPDLFAAAARLDALRTLAQARALKDDVLRADATLAAAHAALEKRAVARGGGAELLRRGGK